MPIATSHLDWIATQQQSMVALLEKWAHINSGSENLVGLARMHDALQSAFKPLGCAAQSIPLPPRQHIDAKGEPYTTPLGKALYLKKHPDAPIQVLLGGHMDTVFSPESPFQTTTHLDADTLRGPGTADMKGGLVIMLKALEALERSPYAGKVGWEVLINPDEEIGSTGSYSLFVAAAKQTQLGLLFEPAFSDGALVDARKGSAYFAVVARGRAAHAGRDFYQGRNAISALVRFLTEAEKLNDRQREVTINVGHISGGGPVNIVPDLAICRLNVRMVNVADLEHIRTALHQLIKKEDSHDGIQLSLTEYASRSPKPFDAKNRALFDALSITAKKLGLELTHRPSGGVCDGNILSEEGLPTIDTLGAIGGNIHTDQEFIKLGSLVERARLVAYFLMQLAAGEVDPAILKERT